jgi:hypothetical protein
VIDEAEATDQPLIEGQQGAGEGGYASERPNTQRQ